MNTAELVLIGALVALGIGCLCVDWYKNRKQPASTPEIDGLTGLDSAWSGLEWGDLPGVEARSSIEHGFGQWGSTIAHTFSAIAHAFSHH